MLKRHSKKEVDSAQPSREDCSLPPDARHLNGLFFYVQRYPAVFIFAENPIGIIFERQFSESDSASSVSG
jgi:hypothetical protein